MSASALPFTAAAIAVKRLVKANIVSFLSQVVQIGTVPALIALRLNAAGHSSLVVGVVAAAPWIAILLVGQWAPTALQRYGFLKTNWIAIALSLFALVGMLMVTAPPILFALNFLLGIGLILRWVSCDTWIVVIAPEHIRGRAIGTHETLMGCGIAAGPLVIALTGAAGRVALISCIGLLALAAMILCSLVDSDGHPNAATKANRFAALRTLPAPLMAGFLAGFVETSSISFLPVFSERQLFALGATAVLSGFGVGGTLLQLPLGWLADRWGYRTAQLLAASVIVIGSVSLPYVEQHAALLFVLLFFWGGAAGGMNTLAVIEAGHRVSDVNVSTAMMAIALAYTVGSATGPVFTGFVVAQLPLLGFSLAMGGATLSYLVTWIVTRPKSPYADGQGTVEKPSV